MSTSIIDVITEADIDALCNPIEGDCESVAVALHRVFGADSFVCIFDPTADDHPVHATANINGTLYDGHGKRTREGLLDHISYLKPSDFHTQPTTPNEMEDAMRDGLKEFSTKKYGTDLLSYDVETVEAVVSEIEDAKDRL